MSLTPLAGYNDILNVLMDWGRSGLIPNTKVIKSYHPPLVDSLTGVAVLMPATTYTTGIIPDYAKEKNMDINDLTNAPRSGSRIQDYNPPIGKLVDPQLIANPKTESAIAAVEYGDLYRESALNANTQAQYEKNIKNLKINTIADRTTRGLTHKPKFIMENLQDAKNFCSIKTAELDSNVVAPQIPNRYEMIPTRVPCAMPGVLNCYVATYDKIDIKKIEYKYENPYFVTPHVSEEFITDPNTKTIVGDINTQTLLIGEDFKYATPEDTNNIPDNPGDYPGDFP